MIFDTSVYASVVLIIISGAVSDSGANYQRARQSEVYHLASSQRKEASLYSSTADTIFDVVTTSDPSAFVCLEYEGRKALQIWDKRVDGEPIVNTFSFLAHFNDGSSIEIAINPEFAFVEAAQTEAMRYVHPIGQLPAILRGGVQRLSVHMGKESFHAGTGQIVAYSEMTSHRIGHHHLEETIFHESVHASLDDQFRLSPEWKKAQQEDGGFLTEYGMQVPDREDLAETALFAFSLTHHPGRIPPVDAQNIMNSIPHRLRFFDKIFSLEQQQPIASEQQNGRNGCPA